MNGVFEDNFELVAADWTKTTAPRNPIANNRDLFEHKWKARSVDR